MNRANAILSKAIVLVVLVGACALVGVPGEAEAQYVAPPAPPSAAYIATVQPEYFEGRPVYLYNNNWYYRDEHGWNYYRTEPPFLRDRRANWDHRPRYHYHR
jgi:hypothetical protein